jgi:hypothetical protein
LASYTCSLSPSPYIKTLLQVDDVVRNSPQLRTYVDGTSDVLQFPAKQAKSLEDVFVDLCHIQLISQSGKQSGDAEDEARHLVLLWLLDKDPLVVLNLPQIAETLQVHLFLQFGLEDVICLEDFLRLLEVGLLPDGASEEEVVEQAECLGAAVEIH